MMYNRKNIIIAVVAALVLGGIIWFFSGGRSPEGDQIGDLVPTSTTSGTREAPPKDVIVPEQGATGVPEGVAIPESVSRASVSDASVSMRSFSIMAQDNQFVPDTVIVRQGDKIDIDITAVDKNYDFTLPDYGFSVQIPKGTTKSIKFGATAEGKFTFYCASCGGLESGPIGYVIIAAK